jgi:hypothetical protein
MPLPWSQVKNGLDPMRYTLLTVPALLKKSTAWQDYCDAERPLEPAIRKVVGSSSAPRGAGTKAAKKSQRKSTWQNGMHP